MAAVELHVNFINHLLNRCVLVQYAGNTAVNVQAPDLCCHEL